MIEAALPGAAVEVSDEDGGGQHLLAVVIGAPVRGPLADRPAPAGQGGGQRALRRRQIHALSVKTEVAGLASLWPWPTRS